MNEIIDNIIAGNLDERDVFLDLFLSFYLFMTIRGHKLNKIAVKGPLLLSLVISLSLFISSLIYPSICSIYESTRQSRLDIGEILDHPKLSSANPVARERAFDRDRDHEYPWK